LYAEQNILYKVMDELCSKKGIQEFAECWRHIQHSCSSQWNCM